MVKNKIRGLLSTLSFDTVMYEFIQLKKEMSKTVSKIEKNAEARIKKFIKATLLFIISIVAIIFILIGIGKILEQITKLVPGSGMILVGCFLLIMVLIARLYSE